MIVADNGSDWWMSIAPDRRLQGLEALHRVKGSDFEVVETGARSVEGELRRGMRLCVVGCGEHAWSSHGPAQKRYAAEHPEVELAACCDVDGGRAEALSPRASASRGPTPTSRRCSRRESPDAVVLGGPGDAHRGRRGAPARARVSPFCSRSRPDAPWPRCDLLIAAAEARTRRPVPHQVAFNRRYAPLVRELRVRLDALGEPERIHHIHYEMTRVDRRDPDFSVTAIHGIDAVRFISASDYAHVRFRYQERPDARARASPTSSWTRRWPRAPRRIWPSARWRAWWSSARSSTRTGTPSSCRCRCGARSIRPDGCTTSKGACWWPSAWATRLGDGTSSWELGGFYAEYEAFLGDLAAGRTPVPEPSRVASVRGGGRAHSRPKERVPSMRSLEERRARCLAGPGSPRPRRRSRSRPPSRRLADRRSGRRRHDATPVISPHDPRVVVEGCDMTGAYITKDGGESWRMFSLGAPPSAFAFDPKDASVIYAATAALWRSEDAGRTWTMVYPDPTKNTVVHAWTDHADFVITTDDPAYAGSGRDVDVHAIAVDPVGHADFSPWR